MTNKEIDALRARVEGDDLLSKDEQLHILQQLHRANQRIQTARKLGFVSKTASPSDRPAAR